MVPKALPGVRKVDGKVGATGTVESTASDDGVSVTFLEVYLEMLNGRLSTRLGVGSMSKIDDLDTMSDTDVNSCLFSRSENVPLPQLSVSASRMSLLESDCRLSEDEPQLLFSREEPTGGNEPSDEPDRGCRPWMFTLFSCDADPPN